MVGTALVNNLKTIQDGRNKTRPDIHIEEIMNMISIIHWKN